MTTASKPGGGVDAPAAAAPAAPAPAADGDALENDDGHIAAGDGEKGVASAEADVAVPPQAAAAEVAAEEEEEKEGSKVCCGMFVEQRELGKAIKSNVMTKKNNLRKLRLFC